MKKNAFNQYAAGALLLILLYFGADSLWTSVGIDWRETYYPAARAVIAGKNPYEAAPTFRNVPWTLLPLLPLALFSERVSGVLYFIASLALYALTAIQLKASRTALIAFLLSPPVVYGMRMLNVDALVLMGFFLPPQIGLFFVLMKPQMGIAMIPFWMVETWRAGGWKSLLRVFTPAALATILSLALFGPSSIGRSNDLLHSSWNASLWPWAFPIGFALTLLAIRNRRAEQAMAASPFLSPYLAYHSWVSVLAGLMRHDVELVLAVIGMWLVAVIRILGYG
ncbi:MAG: hypothetical protein ACOYYF_12545 [Chloroflexota bacterium]|nr:hypothetical protein [Chloroflexota bacterium]MBI5702207.1 hypothetical protein [Chloroflexota bacterium]